MQAQGFLESDSKSSDFHLAIYKKAAALLTLLVKGENGDKTLSSAAPPSKGNALGKWWASFIHAPRVFSLSPKRI